ncbi:hypothetical protein RB195_023450 [Necator americanus]|uniref:Uncharacterized protein n=1 Tax=Necator americanus TaxID=51031 RepID=A0ABR1EJF9_NECAM
MPEGNMESLPTNIRLVMLNCRSLSTDLQQAALSRLLRYLHVPSAALQETRIRDRPLICIDNYTIYCSDADERKVGDCAIAVRNDYNNLVKEFGSTSSRCLVAGLQKTQTLDLSKIRSQQTTIVGIDGNAKTGLEQQPDVLRRGIIDAISATTALFFSALWYGSRKGIGKLNISSSSTWQV